MRKLTKLEKFGMAASIVVAGTYFYMGKVYDPQAKSLKKTIASLNKVIGEINTLDDVKPERVLKMKVKRSEEELARLKRDQGKVLRMMGNESELTNLLQKVHHLMEESGIVAEAIEPRGVGGKGIYESFQRYSLEMRGGYFPFLAFVEALSAMPDPVVIEHVTMTRKEGDGIRITMDLMI